MSDIELRQIMERKGYIKVANEVIRPLALNEKGQITGVIEKDGKERFVVVTLEDAKVYYKTADKPQRLKTDDSNER